MKIVYIITRADAVGGASIHVRDLAREMLRRGHEVMVLVGGRGPVTEQLSAADVPFESVRWLRRQPNPLWDILALAELIRTLRRVKPDLVSTHTAKAGTLGRLACRLLGIPVLYTPHGWPAGDRMPPPSRAIFGFVERLMARWSAAIICVCEFEKRLALDKAIAGPEKLLVIHNGVHDVDQDRRARPDCRPVRICSVARFEPPKDHRTLLQALALIRDMPWELDLAGDGPGELEVRRLAGALDLSGRVRFHGYLPDPSLLLAECQLFALSSRSEALPRSILEAMRAGLPVVATDVGGVSEAVAGGVTGMLAQAGNPQALAAVLRHLLESTQLLKAMGVAARASYERSFRFQTVADRMEAVYATVQSRAALLR
ncbi:MAG: glycosyltransferase family 4 protein [Bryobacteraceae bacterium]|nr:glycosyltransferase family 4 protein [Bryobacteraceae bacterium]